MTERILATIAHAQRIPKERITLESTFEELGIDSMDGVNILFALENEFDITIPDAEAKQIRNVREMVDGVIRLIEDKKEGAAPV